MKLTLQQLIWLMDILLDSLSVPDHAPIFKLSHKARVDLLTSLQNDAAKQEVEVELPGKERVGAEKAGIIVL